MANIKKYLDDILHAIFGKDVRQSIHDGIEKIKMMSMIRKYYKIY